MCKNVETGSDPNADSQPEHVEIRDFIDCRCKDKSIRGEAKSKTDKGSRKQKNSTKQKRKKMLRSDTQNSQEIQDW